MTGSVWPGIVCVVGPPGCAVNWTPICPGFVPQQRSLVIHSLISSCALAALQDAYLLFGTPFHQHRSDTKLAALDQHTPENDHKIDRRLSFDSNLRCTAGNPTVRQLPGAKKNIRHAVESGELAPRKRKQLEKCARETVLILATRVASLFSRT